LWLLGYTVANLPDDAPDAPTMAEAGVPGMEGAQIFWGLYGPPGLPDDIRDKMNAAVNEAITDPAFVALAASSGATPSPGTAADFVALLEAETEAVKSFAEMMPKAE